MNRLEIIEELEDEYGLEVDPNFDADVNELCDGDRCRHSECDCHDNFRSAVRKHLDGVMDKAFSDIYEDQAKRLAARQFAMNVVMLTAGVLIGAGAVLAGSVR